MRSQKDPLSNTHCVPSHIILTLADSHCITQYCSNEKDNKVADIVYEHKGNHKYLHFLLSTFMSILFSLTF